MAKLFQTIKTDRNVLIVNLKGKLNSDFEQWFLMRSDAHHDNPDCNQKLEKLHLDQALERKAGIIDVGDLFDLMQGKRDKRSSKSSLRPEHCRSDYIDSVINDAANFYAPYAKNWINLGYGNHETAIKRHLETDVTQRLAGILNRETGSNIQTLGYTGFIVFKFDVGKRFSKTLWYNHGSGGGAPVTKGAIAAERERAYILADIMLSGHNHQSWLQEVERWRVTIKGKLLRENCWYVKTPTYKDAYNGVEGFETEKGLGPRPVGAWWLKFYFRDHSLRFKIIKAD